MTHMEHHEQTPKGGDVVRLHDGTPVPPELLSPVVVGGGRLVSPEEIEDGLFVKKGCAVKPDDQIFIFDRRTEFDPRLMRWITENIGVLDLETGTYRRYVTKEGDCEPAWWIAAGDEGGETPGSPTAEGEGEGFFGHGCF